MSITATFTPGPYSVTYKTVSIGETEGVKRFQMQALAREIRVDLFGERIVDAIDRGQDWFMQMVLKEWDAGVRGAVYPFGTTFGTPAAPHTGGLYSALSGALVLTPLASSPADTSGIGAGGTINAPTAVIAPNTLIDIPLGSDEQDVPITFLLIPNDSGVPFTET